MNENIQRVLENLRENETYLLEEEIYNDIYTEVCTEILEDLREEIDAIVEERFSEILEVDFIQASRDYDANMSKQIFPGAVTDQQQTAYTNFKRKEAARAHHDNLGTQGAKGKASRRVKVGGVGALGVAAAAGTSLYFWRRYKKAKAQGNDTVAAKELASYRKAKAQGK